MTDSDDLSAQLYAEIQAYLDEHSTRFETVEHEFDTGDGVVDLYIAEQAGHAATIMVAADDATPLDRDVIKQARDGVVAMDGSLFAILTSPHLFLFDYDGEIDISAVTCYQYDVHDKSVAETATTILAALHAHYCQYDMSPLSKTELATYVD